MTVQLQNSSVFAVLPCRNAGRLNRVLTAYLLSVFRAGLLRFCVPLTFALKVMDAGKGFAAAQCAEGSKAKGFKQIFTLNLPETLNFSM